MNALTVPVPDYKHTTQPSLLANMLATFQRSMGEGPKELESPRISRSQSISGRLDASELLQSFKRAHSGAVLLQFDEQHAIAYTHDRQRMLAPRYNGPPAVPLPGPPCFLTCAVWFTF